VDAEGPSERLLDRAALGDGDRQIAALECDVVRVLTAEQFDALLRQFAPDRDTAGMHYVEVRRRLLTVFTYRGCSNPEELADETMDRVARKLLESAQGDIDPRALVFGVAWNIARESFHKARALPLPDDWDRPDPGEFFQADDGPERCDECLHWCLGRLQEGDRTLVLTYFQKEKRAKIAQRLEIARQLGITANALRLRIHRITEHLRPCVVGCMTDKAPDRM
jgi:DNA-directed RNA polymerase specialized sigma24 family protein